MRFFIKSNSKKQFKYHFPFRAARAALLSLLAAVSVLSGCSGDGPGPERGFIVFRESFTFGGGAAPEGYRGILEYGTRIDPGAPAEYVEETEGEDGIRSFKKDSYTQTEKQEYSRIEYSSYAAEDGSHVFIENGGSGRKIGYNAAVSAAQLEYAREHRAGEEALVAAAKRCMAEFTDSYANCELKDNGSAVTAVFFNETSGVRYGDTGFVYMLPDATVISCADLHDPSLYLYDISFLADGEIEAAAVAAVKAAGGGGTVAFTEARLLIDDGGRPVIMAECRRDPESATDAFGAEFVYTVFDIGPLPGDNSAE